MDLAVRLDGLVALERHHDDGPRLMNLVSSS